MITLKLSEKQLDYPFEEILSNANLRARIKCLIVYLRAKGRPCHKIADIARVDGDTVTHAVKKYSQGGLAGLLKGRSA
jgi:transposase